MAKGVRVTQQEFDKTKLLIESGVPTKMIADLIKRDVGTISMIQQSENFEDYYNRRKTINERKMSHKADDQQEVKHSVTIQATHYMMQELQKTNELLTGISAKLAFIVDELTK